MSNNINYKNKYNENIVLYKKHHYTKSLNNIEGGASIVTTARDVLTGAVERIVSGPVEQEDPKVARLKQPIRGIYLPPIPSDTPPTVDPEFEEHNSDIQPDTYLTVVKRTNYSYNLSLLNLFAREIEENDRIAKDAESSGEGERKSEREPKTLIINKKLFRRILCAQVIMLKFKKIIEIIGEICDLLETAKQSVKKEYNMKSKVSLIHNFEILQKIKEHLINIYIITNPSSKKLPENIKSATTFEELYVQLDTIFSAYLETGENEFTPFEQGTLNINIGEDFKSYGDTSETQKDAVKGSICEEFVDNFIGVLKETLDKGPSNRFKITIPPKPVFSKHTKDKDRKELIKYHVIRTIDAIYKETPNYYEPMTREQIKRHLNDEGRQIIFFLQAHLYFARNELSSAKYRLSSLHDELIASNVILCEREIQLSKFY